MADGTHPFAVDSAADQQHKPRRGAPPGRNALPMCSRAGLSARPRLPSARACR